MILRKALPLMVVSGLGLALGLLREVSIAYGFGASWSSDTYFVAFAPLMILIALGTDLGLTMVPLYVRRQSEQGKDDAARIFQRAARTVTLWALVAIAIAAASASLWIPWVAPGLPESATQDAIHLTWILAPAACLILPSMLWQARASVHQRFSLPQVATYAPNLGIVLGALLLAGSLGVIGLGIGQAAGFAVQAAVLFAIASPTTRTVGKPAAKEAPELRAFFITWGLMVAGSLMSKLEPLLQRYYASELGAGEISSLNYAQRLASLPNVLFTTALATVAFPRLSALVLEDLPAFVRLTKKLVWATIGSLGVTALAVYVLRHVIVQALLEYGRFTAADVSRTAELLGYFCLTIVPTGLVIVLVRCILVMRGTHHYVLGGALSFLAWWAIAVGSLPRVGSAALALANAGGYTVLTVSLAAGIVIQLRRWRDASLPQAAASTRS